MRPACEAAVVRRWAGAGPGGFGPRSRRDMPGLLPVTLLLVTAVLVLAAWMGVPPVGPAWAAGEFPAPTGYVNDFAGVLSAGDRDRLEDLCATLERETGAELALVTVRTTGEDSIQMYAVRLFEAWGIGKKGQDNGVLVLAAIDDRRVWVEVGYGLEGALPDGKVGAILDRHLVPAFKEGRYGDGLYACAQALAAEIEAAGEGGAGSRKGPAPGPGLPVRAGLLPLVILGACLAVLVAGVILVVRAAAPRCPACRSRLQVREKVLSPATLLTTGMALVLYTCPRCGYQRQKRRVLPRLVPAPTVGPSHRGGGFWGGGWSGRSGGGFGGFGGGRSGGGGAGRGW